MDRTRPRRALVAVAALAVIGSLLAGPPPASATRGAADPPLTVAPDLLDASLDCSTPFDDTREPVLLVHGTFATGEENYGWNYQPDLLAAGFDVCTVTLPNRSLDDIQVSSEYVVHAVREMAAQAGGRQIDVLGHSQGGLQPRWMTRFYPRTRAHVDDLVTLATPHHGTALGSLGSLGCGACLQMAPDSAFIARINSQDETPGAVDYTSIWTELVDELVIPEPAASTLGGGGDNVANISVQGVGSACAVRPVDHVSIAADGVVHDLVLDAFTNDGPASVVRAAPDCGPANLFFPEPDAAAGGIAMLEDLLTSPTVPSPSVVTSEPATAFYARDDLPTFSDVGPAHRAYWEVEWAAARGVATVRGDRFSPSRAWVRSQAVTWLWRLAGSPPGSPPSSYTDVPADAGYHQGLDWATAEGIVRPSANGRFRPGAPVNRAQLASWLWRYAGEPPGAPDHAVHRRPGRRLVRGRSRLGRRRRHRGRLGRPLPTRSGRRPRLGREHPLPPRPRHRLTTRKRRRKGRTVRPSGRGG